MLMFLLILVHVFDMATTAVYSISSQKYELIQKKECLTSQRNQWQKSINLEHINPNNHHPCAKTHQLWEAVRLLLWQYSHTMPWLAPLPSRSSVGVSPLGTGRGSRLRPQQMGYCPPLQVPPPLSFLAPCCKKTQGKVHEIEYWYKKLSKHKSSWYKSSLNINVKGFLHIYCILF